MTKCTRVPGKRTGARMAVRRLGGSHRNSEGTPRVPVRQVLFGKLQRPRGVVAYAGVELCGVVHERQAVPRQQCVVARAGAVDPWRCFGVRDPWEMLHVAWRNKLLPLLSLPKGRDFLNAFYI